MVCSGLPRCFCLMLGPELSSEPMQCCFLSVHELITLQINSMHPTIHLSVPLEPTFKTLYYSTEYTAPSPTPSSHGQHLACLHCYLVLLEPTPASFLDGHRSVHEEQVAPRAPPPSQEPSFLSTPPSPEQKISRAAPQPPPILPQSLSQSQRSGDADVNRKQLLSARK